MKLTIDMNNNVFANVEIIKKFLIDEQIITNEFFDFEKQCYYEMNKIDFDNYVIDVIKKMLFDDEIDITKNEYTHIEFYFNMYLNENDITLLILYKNDEHIDDVKIVDCDIDVLINELSYNMFVNLLIDYNEKLFI